MKSIRRALKYLLRRKGYSVVPAERSRVRHGFPFTRRVVSAGLLDASPFSLIDVGCSGGIAEQWWAFSPALRAWGIDPQVEECARLEREEKDRGVSYIAALLTGAPAGAEAPSPEAASRPAAAATESKRPAPHRGAEPCTGDLPNPWSTLSTAMALDLHRERGDAGRDGLNHNLWGSQTLSSRHLSVGELLRECGIADVDFVKIDVDGKDLEFLRAFAETLDRSPALGVHIEVNFYGSALPDDNSFHNVDRLMRSHGFDLYDLSTRRYSSRALPAPFLYRMYAQTEFGRILLPCPPPHG